MINTFLISIVTVALAELGDKTQLLAFVLAARFRKPLPIIGGIALATLLNHTIAGLVGSWLAMSLDENVLRWGVGLTFLAVAAWALIPDRFTEKERRSDRYGAFVTALVSFFLVEIGDKTQIATAALAAHFGNVAAVVSGTTIGMLIADGPAVVLGNALAEKIPFRYVRYAAAVMFAMIGTLALLGIGIPTRG